LLTAGLACVPHARADYIFGLDPHPNVITVTDTTPEGRALPPASPEHPVYYVAEDLGFREFGAPVPGDTLPPHKLITSVIVSTLEKHGYLPADRAHRPTEFIIFNWGTMYARTSGGALDGGAQQVTHPADPHFLKFMGGDKVDLMWDTGVNNPNITNGGGMVDARILTQGLRSSIAQKVYEAAEGDLYVAALGGYDFQALRKGKSVELWQTRIACPADGLALADTLPVMIVAAGPQIGRDTPLPVWKDAAEDSQGQVNIGELRVVGTSEPDAPVIDGTKVDRKGAEDTP
jgi:hypothetical protein